MSKQTLTITDNRTGQTIELPIEHDTIPAIGLRQLKVQADDFGMMAYDPGYTNTASCKSRITYVDGDRGILRYRGYPIEQLAEKSTFLEVAHLFTLRRTAGGKQVDRLERAHYGAHAYRQRPDRFAQELPRGRPSDGHSHQCSRSDVHSLPGGQAGT